MNLVLVGLNHKTAPVEVRERVAFPDHHLALALRRLRGDFGVPEGMIVSTCNRVEIIAEAGTTGDEEPIKKFLYCYHSLQPSALDHHLYSYRSTDVVKHVFRVASSLDSMIVGETQILGQLKQAFDRALSAGSVGAYLNQLLPRAFFVAKRIRTETRIGNSAISVSYVAVELARKIFGDLQGKSILLIGAGKMSMLAAHNLVNSGISRVFVANRTPEKSVQLTSRFSGTPVPFNELESYLVESDIVLVSAGSNSFVLEKDLLQRVIRRRKYSPLFVIDISVPRNVDPQVNEIENVFLYDIDDLQSVVSANIQERQREAEIAEEIVNEEVELFLKQSRSNNMGPLISALRQRIEEICLEDLEVSKNSLSPEEYERQKGALVRAAHKIAHPLIVQLKETSQDPEECHYHLRMIRKVFDLDEKP
ncbi:MAG: glutamyl-tRNA reductase [Acidobacteriota bacterium]